VPDAVRLTGSHLRLSAAVAAPLLEAGSVQVVLAPRADGVLLVAPGAGPHALRFNKRAVFTIAKQRSAEGDRVVALYELLEGEPVAVDDDGACTWTWDADFRTLTVHHPRLADALVRAEARRTPPLEQVPC
jgi:hypothetical protein